MKLRWLALALSLSCIASAETLRYWVEPPETPGDSQLADWALGAWQQASAGRLILKRIEKPEHAQIRLHWAKREQSLYGEARPIQVDGKTGAEVYVLTAADSGDSLLRDAIVYLTCLHETGHALGLAHTAGFDDIMYSFQYGGDIPEYFARYRRKLKVRDDIRKNPGLSPQDRLRITK